MFREHLSIQFCKLRRYFREHWGIRLAMLIFLRIRLNIQFMLRSYGNISLENKPIRFELYILESGNRVSQIDEKVKLMTQWESTNWGCCKTNWTCASLHNLQNNDLYLLTHNSLKTISQIRSLCFPLLMPKLRVLFTP